MACFYDNGEIQFNSLDILKEFYKNTNIIRNDEIFSSEELQKNTTERILSGRYTHDYSKNLNTEVTKFITTANDLLKLIPGIDKNQNRLAPEYILEERVSNFVKNQLKINKSQNLTEYIPEVEEMFSKIIDTIPDFYKDRVGEIKYLINEILEEIKMEEHNKDFGIFLHEILSDKIRGNENSYKNAIDKYLKNEKNSPIVGTDSIKNWSDQIDYVINKIHEAILKNGTPISEIFMVYNDSEKSSDRFALKGKLDLITVDNKGNAHIFEIKVSKNSYNKNHWDSVKLLTLDWQLALYKQLLGQHINVDNTELYVIPIVLEEPGNSESLIFEGVHNRTVENPQLRNGWMETVANYIIPRKIFGEYDPDKLKNFKDKLHQLFGPDYAVKLESKEKNLEDIIKSIENNQKKYGGKFKFFNDYRGMDNLPYGWNETDTLDEMIPNIEVYVQHANTKKDKKVVDLKSALKTAITNNQKIDTNNDSYDIQLNRLLLEYLSDSWEVIDEFPESTELGLLILRNKNSGQINIISLSANQFLANSKIEGFTEGDIEYAKVFLFINEYKDLLLPYSSNKIGEIIIYNPENKKPYYRTTHTEFKKFYDLMKLSKFSDTDLKISLENNFLGVVNVALQNLDNFYRSFRNELVKDEIGSIINPLLGDSDLTLTKLIEAQKAYFALYPEYKNKTFAHELNFEDRNEVILALLNTAILSFHRDDIDADFQNISDFSMNISDFKTLFSSLYSNNNPTYDKEGRRITGVFQGLKWSTPDWVPSKFLRSFNKLISGANSRIAELMLEESERITKLTLEYYDKINFRESERFLIGETQTKYKNLWKQSGNTVSQEFKTKNPYKEDVENALTDVEREYLKRILFEINIYKLGLDENEVRSLDPMKFESITKNDDIAKAIENESYFDMPLVRREELSRYGEVFKTTGQNVIEKLKPYTHEVMDFLDNRGLTPEDLNTLEEARLGFYEMYDTYARHTPEFKARMLSKHGINHFEFNLDTIANRLIYNKIRKHIYDQVFPVVNAYIWWMKLKAGKEGGKSGEIEKQLNYVYDQIKLAAYGEHIIDPEFKDMSIIQSAIKRVSTAAMLAFRPILLIKELVIGTAKGISLAATQIYGKDQFSVKDLTKAYEKMMTIDKKFSQEFNLIDRINHFYRFANMDANTIAMKLQADRHGMVMRGLGRYMYASNTIPDYYNRLVLFLAKMIHDGSYEAHTIENGVFKYDATKDKRFSYYLENREKYKKSNGEFEIAPNDEKYNTQRRKYLFLIDQLNKEYAIFGKTFTESDIVPKAYSDIERNSFKSFTDMAYGYYDKDAQQQATNTWWGITWMQFMQYWPGKMKMWFGKPTEKSGEDSAWGTQKQLTTTEGQLLWRKTIQKDDGSLDVQLVTENTGDPAIEWVGTPFEGLAMSVMSTLKDLATLNFSAIKDDKQRLGRVAFAINDAIFMYIMFTIFSMIFKAMGGSSNDGFSKELIQFGESVSTKVANEQNMFNSTFGALRSDPAWLSWASRFARDMGDVIKDEKTILEAAASNTGALEMFRE